jgi:hypothetical protein
MRAVIDLIRPFIAPIAMIVAVSGILLAFDDSRSRSSADMPRVAIVQHTTQAAIDEGVKGIIEGLAAKGRIDGRTVRLSLFNAQGDLATANDIARRATDGSNDLIISASTLSLQTVANANRQSKVPHVYGIIVKSQRSGVGIGAGGGAPGNMGAVGGVGVAGGGGEDDDVADGEVKRRAAALAAGMDEFVTKPIDAARLLAVATRFTARPKPATL